MEPPNLTEDAVSRRMNRIKDPEFGRTIVDLGYVQGVDLRGDQVGPSSYFPIQALLPVKSSRVRFGRFSASFPESNRSNWKPGGK